MSSPKSAIVAGAAVVALTAIPLFKGASEAKQLREQIGELDERRTTAATTIERLEAEAAIAKDAAAAAGSTRTVRDLIEHSEKKVDVDEMMDSIMEVMMSQDMVAMLKIFLPLANLDRDEYNRLLEELEAHKGNAQTKMMVIQMMSMFAPTDNPSEAIERLVKLGVEPYSYSNLLGQWAADSPDAALAWYRTKLAEGALDGKGINSRPERYLLSQLISGVAKNSPGRGVDLLIAEVTPADNHAHNAVHQLARSLGESMTEGGSDRELRRLLEWDADGNFQQAIVQSAMGGALRDAEFGEVTRFAETYHEDPSNQQAAVINHISSQHDQPFSERADQLVGYLPSDRAPDAIRNMASNNYFSENNSGEIQTWVEEQPGGPIRDAGYRGLVDHQLNRGEFENALELGSQIADPEQRDEALIDLGDRWLDSDEGAAREALPPDIIERIEAEDDAILTTRATYSTAPDGSTVVTEEVIEATD
jgi:urease gamma subunit